MILAIIGQRELTEEQVSPIVLDAISKLNPSKIVSGGAKGVDSIAVSIAKSLSLTTEEFLPEFKSQSRADIVMGYYERNMRIVNACDAVLAIVGNRKTGGTYYTIGYAEKMGKPITICHV